MPEWSYWVARDDKDGVWISFDGVEPRAPKAFVRRGDEVAMVDCAVCFHGGSVKLQLPHRVFIENDVFEVVDPDGVGTVCLEFGS